MARPLAVIGITYFLALLVANTVGNPASAVVSALLFLFFILALFFRSLRSRAGLMAALLAAGARLLCLRLLRCRRDPAAVGFRGGKAHGDRPGDGRACGERRRRQGDAGGGGRTAPGNPAVSVDHRPGVQWSARGTY